MRRGALPVLLAAAVATSAPAAGAVDPAGIVVGRSIDRIMLGSTPALVRARLGNPLRQTTGTGPLGTPVTHLHYRLVDLDLERLGSGGPVVVRITTGSRRLRTAGGLGVGSSVGSLQRLRGIVCNLDSNGGNCQIGSPSRPRGHVTTFVFAYGRVTAVVVSLGLDSPGG